MEEEIDVELNLGKELADKLRKMNKKELLNHLIVVILRSQVQEQTIEELEQQIKKNKETYQGDNEKIAKKLSISERHLEQARAMLEAAMEKWDWYE